MLGIGTSQQEHVGGPPDRITSIPVRPTLFRAYTRFPPSTVQYRERGANTFTGRSVPLMPSTFARHPVGGIADDPGHDPLGESPGREHGQQEQENSLRFHRNHTQPRVTKANSTHRGKYRLER